ncbi:MAG TPA: GGDEF domain-containing protein [bacterium (Candidatus Stahlbacteria)]|nr:GGDEF domain-containing protein [Candidatus Stahlbacteria bacterium]
MRKRKPVLIVVDGPVVIQSLLLDEGKYLIGRTNDCDLILPSRGVSRHHALVEKRGKKFFIKDLNSTNGTIINGTKIRKAALNPGDEIEICDYRLIFDLKTHGTSETQIELKGKETSKLEGIYNQIKNRIKNLDLEKEFDKYHKIVKRSRRRLSDRVNLDSLTGIYNRGFFEKTIIDLMKTKQMFSLIMLDIDHFKQVNDKYGHQKGDDVLRMIAFLIKNSCRTTDICARYGGEEFAIIFPDMDLNTARNVSEDIRKAIKNRSSELTGIPITISIGIAGYPTHGREKNKIVKAADHALYRSKAGGRDRVTVHEV